MAVGCRWSWVVLIFFSFSWVAAERRQRQACPALLVPCFKLADSGGGHFCPSLLQGDTGLLTGTDGRGMADAIIVIAASVAWLRRTLITSVGTQVIYPTWLCMWSDVTLLLRVFISITFLSREHSSQSINFIKRECSIDSSTGSAQQHFIPQDSEPFPSIPICPNRVRTHF